MSASEITLDDLEAWGHDTIAENFVELSEEVAEFDESLRAPYCSAQRASWCLAR